MSKVIDLTEVVLNAHYTSMKISHSLARIVQLQAEALNFYATLKERKDDEPNLRREFGCGCCAMTNDANGEGDYDNRGLQGITAKEAIEAAERIASGDL